MSVEAPVVARDRAVGRLEVWGWLVLIGVLLLALYADTLRQLVAQWWREEDYNHGFLVPVFSGWLVWQDRERLRRLPRTGQGAGLLVLAAALLLFVVGSVGAELFLQRSSLILALVGLLLALAGGPFVKAVAFPLAFLVFMIPLPAIVRNAIAFPLQLFAAQAATMCISGAGIPVLREGNVIVLAQTTLEVAEACSGIRSLQALLALSTVYAYLAQKVLWKRIVLVVSAVPIAIAANVFRVGGTGFLAHYFGMSAAEGFYHGLAGYLMFGVAFLGLLACGAALEKLAPAPKALPPEA